MLPAVKVFAVAALLGGGAVGTFALAGGFGPKGNGSGNGETAQVAANEGVVKPATTEQGAPAPEVTTSTLTALPAGGVARDGSSTLEPEVQQEVGVEAQRGAGLGSDVQAQQQSGPQPQKVSSDSYEEVQTDLQAGAPVSSQNNTLDIASGNQGATAGRKDGPSDVDGTRSENPVSQGVTSSESQETKDSNTVEDQNGEVVRSGGQVQSTDSQPLTVDGTSKEQGDTTDGKSTLEPSSALEGSGASQTSTQVSNGPASGESGISGSNPGSKGDGVEEITSSEEGARTA